MISSADGQKKEKEREREREEGRKERRDGDLTKTQCVRCLVPFREALRLI